MRVVFIFCLGNICILQTFRQYIRMAEMLQHRDNILYGRSQISRIIVVTTFHGNIVKTYFNHSVELQTKKNGGGGEERKKRPKSKFVVLFSILY